MKILLVLIIPLFFSINVQGGVIGSFSGHVGSGTSGIYYDVELDIAFFDYEAIARIGSLFDSLRVDETDANSYFYANASNDPYFQTAVGLLTNGEEDGIGAEIGFLPCSGIDPCAAGFVGTESSKFFDGNRIDFHGYTIEEFELFVDSVVIDTDDSANRTEADIYFTLNVYGTEPLPPPPLIDVSINIQSPSGTEQECASPVGTNVSITSTVDTPEPALIQYVEWTIGSAFFYGESINPVLPLGEHTITVTAALTTGETATDTVVVKVLDSQPPDVIAKFVDEKTMQVITQASSRNKVILFVDVTDICDPEPTVTAIVGVSSDNGGVFSFDKSNKALSLKSISDEEDAILSVIATDGEGNVATENVKLRILQ